MRLELLESQACVPLTPEGPQGVRALHAVPRVVVLLLALRVLTLVVLPFPILVTTLVALFDGLDVGDTGSCEVWRGRNRRPLLLPPETRSGALSCLPNAANVDLGGLGGSSAVVAGQRVLAGELGLARAAACSKQQATNTTAGGLISES